MCKDLDQEGSAMPFLVCARAMRAMRVCFWGSRGDGDGDGGRGGRNRSE